jgi:hypothetical protein
MLGRQPVRRVLSICLLAAVASTNAAPAPSVQDLCTASPIKPGFRGTKLAPIFDAIAKIPEKDEFESTAAFKARRLAALATLAPVSQCLVEFSGIHFATYDADKQRIEFDLRELDPSDASLKGATRYLEYSRETLERHDYVGTNALGVARKIEAGSERIRGVVFESATFYASLKRLGAKAGEYNDVQFWLPMAGDRARDLLPHLGALISYTWTPDYYGVEETTHYPTFDSPFDTKTKYELLKGKVRRVALFDDRTGDVLYEKGLP